MTFRYAGFWIRAVASLIDMALLTLVSWGIELAALGAWYWAERLMGIGAAAHGVAFDDMINGFWQQVIDAIVYTLLSAPYFIYGHFKYQTTLGKRVLRLYVVRESDGLRITMRQSVIRYLCYLLSYLPVGAGYLMAAFNPKKKALHDSVAGTICVRESKAPAANQVSHAG